MINKKRLIALTQKVLSIDSQNPPGKELKLAKFIETDMRSLGIDVKTYTYAKHRPNIVATLKGSMPRNRAEKEALLLTPHFDTVPIGDGWKFDPFGSQIVGNKLYGRGTTDDKGNLASAMEVMRSLVEDGFKPKKDIVMAATVDEETGSYYGIIPLLEKKVIAPGFALVLDSDEFNTIIAQKGLFHMRVQVFGKKAHGAYNWLGENAIEASARIITKLKKIRFKYKKHLFLKPPTINIGTIKGGDKVNMVADFCEFSVDLRFLPGMDPKELLAEIKQIARSEAKRSKVIIDDLQDPYEIDLNNKFVKLWGDAVRKSKAKAILKGSEGATVITFFKKYKIPAFATGFGAHGTAHSTDEYINLSTLSRGTKALEFFVKKYDETC